ncbi:unnamed protein product [Closterium sp. Yama58-4]|nr:unnamed protein product [Closterium sp. Yama58-4]
MCFHLESNRPMELRLNVVLLLQRGARSPRRDLGLSPSENPLPPLQGSHEAAPPDRAHSIMVDIQDFCWVNEDYCVRVYIPFPGIDAIPPSYISSSFTDSSFCLLIRGIRDGVCYRLALDSLYGEIQPNLCCHLVYKDKLEITLSKVTSGPSDGPDTNIFTWFSLRL